MNPYEVTQRGLDSSGRPLKNTAIKWQAFDTINERMGGKLVIVQGAFMGSSGADASAGTHVYAGCNDVRRWNLTYTEAGRVIDIANSVGDIWWERYAPTFDPHFHNLLPNDHPLHPDAAAQVAYFKRGESGLASHGPDPHKRPSPFPVFRFQEEFMSDADVSQINRKLDNILDRVNAGFSGERERDANERTRDAERHQKLTQLMGKQVDQMGIVLNMLNEDDSELAREVKQLLRQNRKQLLLELRADPTTDGTPDNPSDETLDQA